MPPQAASTTVLIIPLILNMLPAPPPQQTWPPVANSPEIVDYHIADHQPHPHDLSSDPSAEDHRSWLPPMDICGGHFDTANTTDSSILLLLLVSLPGQQDQPARHCGSNSTRVSNRSAAPWTSLPLEPAGVYGMPPQASDKPVCFDPFGSNISLDVGLFSLSSDSSLLSMPPMIGTEDGQIYDHLEAPALFGLVVCNGSFVPSTFQDGNGSFIPSTSQDAPRQLLRFMDNITASQSRKLLGTNLHDHPQVPIRKKKKKKVAAAAGLPLGLVLLPLLCLLAGLLYWCTRMRMPSQNERPVQAADQLCPSGPRPYSHRELAAATCGFSDEGKIGRGGFGPVYRGYLRDQGCHVAIKVMSSQGVHDQGRREFQAEVKVMTRLRHRNIVHLLGWCDDGPGGLMLVYELMPNGSLDKHLYDPQRLLSWSNRYKIALGVGSAILYLHTECEQRVLHGDIKPANILLHHSCDAKLGDFGLARLADHGADSCTTQFVAGTPGYMDPEFLSTQRPCAESDVFSFGVVLLEIACGRRPTTTPARSNGSAPPLLLLNWVRGLYRANSILAAADRRLDGEFDDDQMRRVLVVGLWCTHHDRSQRPSMLQAMDLLRRQDSELPLVGLGMHGSDAVRSLEETAYGDFSAEDSASETDTAYHTSTDYSCLE